MNDIVSSTQTVLQQLAQDMSRQSTPPGTLYVLATPIGNRADLTVRAVYILHLADVVAAEDTRVAGHLLHGLGLHKPLIACDAYREQAAVEQLIHHLAQGHRVVLCSDAGTPCISDPGSKVVASVRAAGYRVLPVPGVSSLTAAVSASGLVEHSLHFHAFAPNKGAPRKAFYAQLCAAPQAQVWFEAPHRIEDAAAILAQLVPARLVCVARELTKQFEHITTMPAHELPHWLAQDSDRIRGEFVLILQAVATQQDQGQQTQALALAQLLTQALPASKAAALAAKHYDVDRSTLYAALQDQKQAQDD